MDLLWTYETPKIPFGPQTVSLDLSRYKLIYVIFKRDASESRIMNVSVILKIGNSAHVISEYADVIIRRDISDSNNNGITFGIGSIMNTSVDNNSKLVPIYIYGIV